MKHIPNLSKSFVCRLGVLSVFAAAIIVSVSGYGQDYRRRGPMMTTNPAPAYPSVPQNQTYTPPASGIQNPTQIRGTTQSMPTQAQPTGANPYGTNPNGVAVPTAPSNPFSGVSANPFQPTPSTGYGYGPNVAPAQPTIQRNPFQVQQSTARPIQPATIGGQISTQPIARPFDDQPPQSPYSPYMYIYAGRGGIGGGGGDNYNLFVRPMMEQQQYNRQMVQQVESLQQTIQRQQQQIQQQNRTLNQLQQEGIIPTQPNPTIDNNPNSAQQYFNQQYQQYFNQQNRY